MRREGRVRGPRYRASIAGSVGTLTADEERDLVARTRPPHSPEVMSDAWDKLGRVALRLAGVAVSVCVSHRSARIVNSADFIDVAAEAILRAFSKFDLSIAAKPSTYAITAARHAVHDAVSSTSSPFHVPLGTIKAVFQRKPQVTKETVDAVMFAMRPYDSHTEAGQDALRSFVAPDHTDEVDDAEEARHLVGIAMADLPERERKIISGRFGLNGGKEKEWKAVGSDVGLGVDYVQVVAKKAMGSMRETLLRVAG